MKKSILDKIFYYLFIYLIAFPFIPQLIKSTDTQPNLIIFFILFFLFGSVYRRNKLDFKFNKNIYWYLFFFILVFIILIINILFFRIHPNLNRYISFFQFMIAVYCGLFIKIDIIENWFTKILLVYIVFTVLYFLSNGSLENILISSREMNSNDLVKLGRGARTLSPEPSFFALHLFSLFILNKVYHYYYGIKEKNINKNYILISIMLLLSLSGYGMLLFFLITLFEFPKIIFFLMILIFAFGSLFIVKIQSFESLRSFGLLFKIFTDDPLSILETDTSISTRIFSFNFYVNSIKDNIVFGDNFSVLEGGGLVSLISGLGIVGLIFTIILIFKLFRYFKNLTYFFLFISWVAINLISGPIGIPIFGLIIGLFFKKNHNNSYLV